MLKKTAFYAGSAALALILSACASQQPAPVVVGNSGSNSGSANTTSNNPYGAAPYETNAANNDAPYTPPASTPPANSSYPSGPTGSYTPSYAPVDINAATHTVVRGDTVYNISKRYQITQDNLRAWNGLADNTISVGQTLRVKPNGYSAPTATASVPTPPPTHTASPKPTPAPLNTPTVSTGGTRTVSGITWQRPTVVAAADGKVVYAGSGLRGYGNLVIIQHNSSYLSAYGHNQRLLVNEGQQVKRGQTIANMGNTDASRTQLHFEVRQNGKPVNPANYVAF